MRFDSGFFDDVCDIGCEHHRFYNTSGIIPPILLKIKLELVTVIVLSHSRNESQLNRKSDVRLWNWLPINFCFNFSLIAHIYKWIGSAKCLSYKRRWHPKMYFGTWAKMPSNFIYSIFPDRFDSANIHNDLCAGVTKGRASFIKTRRMKMKKRRTQKIERASMALHSRTLSYWILHYNISISHAD